MEFPSQGSYGCVNVRALTHCARLGLDVCPNAPETPLIPLCHRRNLLDQLFLKSVKQEDQWSNALLEKSDFSPKYLFLT